MLYWACPTMFPHAQVERPRFPWESISMTALALGTQPRYPWLFLPAAPPPVVFAPQPSPAPVEQMVPPAALKPQRKRLYSSIVDDNADDTRALEVGKLLEVLEPGLKHSEVGRNILQAQLEEKGQDYVINIIQDTIANKATSTLAARTGAMLQYIYWFQRTAATGEEVFPVVENRLYDYLRFLASSSAAPTRGSSMISSWSFFVNVLGFDDPTSACSSLRCVGAKHRMHVRKQPTKQKNPQSVNMLIALEFATTWARDPWVQALAGLCVLCVYARLRVSDVCRIKKITDTSFVTDSGENAGTVEAGALGTKTAKTKAKMTRFLPIVFGVKGLSGTSWWKNFLAARAELGLAVVPSDGGECPLLLPSSTCAGCPVESGEVSIFLLGFLEIVGFQPSEVAGLASHSLKPTCLSFCAKAGLSLQSRQLLGYHVVKGQASALIYRRDNVGAPVEELCGIIDDVSAGKFVPDEVRGRRYPDTKISAVEKLAEVFPLRELRYLISGVRVCEFARRDTDRLAVERDPAPARNAPVLPKDASDVSSFSCDEAAPTHIDALAPEEAGPELVGTIFQADASAGAASSSSVAPTFVRHKTRGTVHCLSSDLGRARCGEVLFDRYEIVPWSPGLWPKCSRPNCFG